MPSVGSFNDLNLKARGSQSKASTSKESLNEALPNGSHTSHERGFSDIQNKPISSTEELKNSLQSKSSPQRKDVLPSTSNENSNDSLPGGSKNNHRPTRTTPKRKASEILNSEGRKPPRTTPIRSKSVLSVAKPHLIPLVKTPKSKFIGASPKVAGTSSSKSDDETDRDWTPSKTLAKNCTQDIQSPSTSTTPSSGKKPFYCRTCDISFPNRSALKTHESDMHLSKSLLRETQLGLRNTPKRKSVNGSGKETPSRKTPSKSKSVGATVVKTSTADQEKSFKCIPCDETFLNSVALGNHELGFHKVSNNAPVQPLWSPRNTPRRKVSTARSTHEKDFQNYTLTDVEQSILNSYCAVIAKKAKISLAGPRLPKDCRPIIKKLSPSFIEAMTGDIEE